MNSIYTRMVLAIAVLALSSMAVARQASESISLRYIGQQYTLISLQDTKQQVLHSRKLVTHQSMQLPLLNTKGKKYKKIIVTVGERRLELRLTCKPKQRAKRLGLDVFEISYSAAFTKKTPCFVSDSQPEPLDATA